MAIGPLFGTLGVLNKLYYGLMAKREGSSPKKNNKMTYFYKILDLRFCVIVFDFMKCMKTPNLALEYFCDITPKRSVKFCKRTGVKVYKLSRTKRI